MNSRKISELADLILDALAENAQGRPPHWGTVAGYVDEIKELAEEENHIWGVKTGDFDRNTVIQAISARLVPPYVGERTMKHQENNAEEGIWWERNEDLHELHAICGFTIDAFTYRCSECRSNPENPYACGKEFIALTWYH